MALQSLTIGGARFRAGSWRTSPDLAYLVPISPAHMLTRPVLEQVRAALEDDGFGGVVTAAVAPPERSAFLEDGFVDREQLHLLRHNLQGLPGGGLFPRRRPKQIRIERGTRSDREAVLALDALTFDDFWRLDDEGLDDAVHATPISRMRVVRDPEIVGYAVAGRAGSQGFLQRLSVHPDQQGSGIGSALVYDALHWMRRRGADVGWVNTQESNHRALGLYRHLGFRPADHDLTVLARTLP